MPCNKVGGAVYKRVFDGNTHDHLVLSSIESLRATTKRGGSTEMADTTTTTSKQATPAKRRSTTTRKPASTRKTGTTRATGRSTAAKSPTRATARRNRPIAANETREAATANARAARTTAKQGRNVAERAALVYVGATLEARDRAVAIVSDLREVATTRKGAEKRISKLERRGNTARNQFERDVRKARTRIERELRGRRRDAERLVRRSRTRAEREASSIEREADSRPNVVADQVARVETVLQAGVTAGERVATTARERVQALA
jgi:hypothetical protein